MGCILSRIKVCPENPELSGKIPVFWFIYLFVCLLPVGCINYADLLAIFAPLIRTCKAQEMGKKPSRMVTCKP